MRIRTIEELWLSPEVKVNCFVEPALLPTGGIMVITGEPGIGKSWLVQEASFQLATGRRLWCLFPTRKVKVIHLEIEKGTIIAENRFRSEVWKSFYKDSVGYLGYSDEPFDIESSHGVKTLQMAIEDFEARVIVVDSYSVTLGDEIELANQKRAIRAYRGIAKQMGCSFILIQHLRKRPSVFDQKDKEFYDAPLRLDDLRGSKFLEYEVDTVVGLVKSKRKGERILGFLKTSYCPVSLDEVDPISFTFNATHPEPFYPAEEGLHRILAYLSEYGATSIEELTKANVSRSTVYKSVERLEQLGLVEVFHGKGRGHETYVSV